MRLFNNSNSMDVILSCCKPLGESCTDSAKLIGTLVSIWPKKQWAEDGPDIFRWRWIVIHHFYILFDDSKLGQICHSLLIAQMVSCMDSNQQSRLFCFFSDNSCSVAFLAGPSLAATRLFSGLGSIATEASWLARACGAGKWDGNGVQKSFCKGPRHLWYFWYAIIILWTYSTYMR